MTSVIPPAPSRDAFDRALQQVGSGGAPAGLRADVTDSWRRALAQRLDPDGGPAALELQQAALRQYRAAHPLASVLPMIHRLLIRHTFDANLIVAIGDAGGRLLWIDGDRQLRRRAEGIAFVEGAEWSERTVGTSAPSTALALGRGIQIRQAEHFLRQVHPWSCTAVPVRDPGTGSLVGVIDITGGDDAAAPATLLLLEATVAAIEAELQLTRLRAGQGERAPARPVGVGAQPPRRVSVQPTVLRVLGRERGLLEHAGRTIELSARHAELLTVLAWHPHGLSAEALAAAVYGRDDATVTLRAEMVRLRRALADAPALVPETRPYRLPQRLELDAHRTLAFLSRGAHRVALSSYPGAVLPASASPGVEAIRAEVAEELRQAMLYDASADALLDYARTDAAAEDVEVWRAVLDRLPARSPKRSGVVARLERLHALFG